jgi:hypothetical protein
MRQSQTRSTGPARSTPTRPGLVTFAAVMLFLLGGLQLATAFAELFHAAWVLGNIPGAYGGYFWVWGIIDIVYAAVVLYAGYAILQGLNIGRMLGLIIAVFSAIRWFFYLAYFPWTAAIVIAIDVLIIYALTAHAEYFQG